MYVRCQCYVISATAISLYLGAQEEECCTHGNGTIVGKGMLLSISGSSF